MAGPTPRDARTSRFERLLGWAEVLPPTCFIILGVGVSEVLTAAGVAASSWAFHGRVATDFLVTGAVASGVVSSAVLTLLVSVLSRLRGVERSLAEQRRSASEAQLRWARIVEHSDWGLAVSEAASGKLELVSPALAKLHGEPVEGLMGRTLPDLFEARERAAALARLDAARTGTSQRFETVQVRRDGSTFPAQVDVALIRTAGGPAELVVNVQDLGERKRLETQLTVADRLASLGMLAAGVAHEINNPLAYILSNLRFASETLRAASESLSPCQRTELADAIDEAIQGAARVRDVVRDLKSYSRPTTDVGPVDVQRAVETSVRMVWNDLRLRARLVREYGSIPQVDAKEAQLGQVVLNLLGNAIQATPEGRADQHEVRLTLRTAADGRAVIEVRDTGAGIPAEVLPKIFEPFYTTKPAGVGTGLGLYVCQNIVRSLGGEIAVESEVGRGTTVRVLLPAAPERSAAATEAPEASSTAPVRKARVLVIDDEPVIALVIQRTLPHHEVVGVTRAEDALARLLKGERFDIIICDLMMPEMTGMQFHAELDRAAPAEARRVIFISGATSTDRVQEFYQRAQNPHLDKPFDGSALRRLVDGLLC